MVTLVRATPKTIGMAVRFLRLGRQLTQAQLAACAGLKQSTISSIEAGKSTTVENLSMLAAALEINLSRLIEAAETMEQSQGALAGFIHTTDVLADTLDPGAITTLFERAT